MTSSRVVRVTFDVGTPESRALPGTLPGPVKLQLAVWAQSLLTLQLTLVLPGANTLPEAGTQLRLTIGQVEVALIV